MPSRTKNKSLKDFLLIYGTSIVLIVLAFSITFHFVKPAPPNSVRLATGNPNNVYHQLGLAYQKELKQQGITVELVPSNGSVENLRLLEEQKVDIAFVQSGISNKDLHPFESLGSLYYEPLWLFHRNDTSIKFLTDLTGKNLAVGSTGSGTQPVALALLNDNGINQTNSKLLNLSGQEAADQLKNGQVDAMFLVTGPQNTLIHSLLSDPSINLYSFKRGDAYSRLHHFLSTVSLPQGVMNMTENTPEQTIDLLAPAATMVIDENFHPAIASLMLQTASKIHSKGGVLEPINTFPSPKFVDFPLSKEATRYYKSGAPFLQRYLPFWLANLVDRLIVLLIPLITLLIPLLKVLPPTYRWRIRSRIYRWYDQLREVEYQSELTDEKEMLSELLDELLTIEKELMMTDIPKSYAESQYNLRLHIRLIRERLESKLR